MSCDCSYYEQPDFLTVTDVRKSRKRYRCCECYREIPIGLEYRVITGKWDGQLTTYRQCERCAGIWDALTELGHCLGYTAMEDDYNEYLHDHERHKEQGGKSAREIMRGGNWTLFIKNKLEGIQNV